MVHQEIAVDEAPPPLPSGRGEPRFRLAPAAALAHHAAAIADLAGRCRLPNPFFLPEFLGPAIQALGRGSVELALIADATGRLIFFAPVVAGGLEKGLFSAVRVWTHPYAPLGVPLMDMARLDEAAAALIDGLGRAGRRCLVLPDVPVDAPELAALRRHAQARGLSCRATALDSRPVLRADRPGGAQLFRGMVSRKKRKELARQLRRLSEVAPVSFAVFRRAEEVATALEAFLLVEAAGWKGRQGTAMAQSPDLKAFAAAAIANLARRNGVIIDVMFVGESPAAALVRFQADGLSIAWKIAYDEHFAAFSPGAQLMSHLTRAWLADPAVARVDPVCAADNPLLGQLWDEREVYATLVLATGPAALAPRLRAGMAGAVHQARRLARRARTALPLPFDRQARRTP
jgi:CelD/BcsL family acetyltransferase involved in cellulose biosynthesis